MGECCTAAALSVWNQRTFWQHGSFTSHSVAVKAGVAGRACASRQKCLFFFAFEQEGRGWGGSWLLIMSVLWRQEWKARQRMSPLRGSNTRTYSVGNKQTRMQPRLTGVCTRAHVGLTRHFCVLSLWRKMAVRPSSMHSFFFISHRSVPEQIMGFTFFCAYVVPQEGRRAGAVNGLNLPCRRVTTKQPRHQHLVPQVQLVRLLWANRSGEPGEISSGVLQVNTTRAKFKAHATKISLFYYLYR